MKAWKALKHSDDFTRSLKWPSRTCIMEFKGFSRAPRATESEALLLHQGLESPSNSQLHNIAKATQSLVGP